MTASSATAVRLLVSGRVQGVGFRYGLTMAAGQVGVRGRVRNLADGRVEARLQGPASAVESVVEWARKGGPPRGRVDDVTVQAVAVEPGLSGFQVTG